MSCHALVKPWYNPITQSSSLNISIELTHKQLVTGLSFLNAEYFYQCAFADSDPTRRLLHVQTSTRLTQPDLVNLSSHNSYGNKFSVSPLIYLRTVKMFKIASLLQQLMMKIDDANPSYASLAGNYFQRSLTVFVIHSRFFQVCVLR